MKSISYDSFSRQFDSSPIIHQSSFFSSSLTNPGSRPASPFSVIARLRPSPKASGSNKGETVEVSEDQTYMVISKNKSDAYQTHQFSFDFIHDENSVQKTFYVQSIAPLIQDALQGTNVCVFAYGQSKSGKTFTLEGAGEEKRGAIPRAVEAVFSFLRDNAATTRGVIRVSYLMIHNETLTDLLGPATSTLKIVDKDRTVGITGLTEVSLQTPNDITEILKRGRAMKNNGRPPDFHSRCHTVLTLGLEFATQMQGGAPSIMTSKIHFVDLAASERARETTSTTSRGDESQKIAKAFTALATVVAFLKGRHVPYRDSKLTHLLKDSLTEHSRCLLVSTMLSNMENFNETLATAKYCSRIRQSASLLTVGPDVSGGSSLGAPSPASVAFSVQNGGTTPVFSTMGNLRLPDPLTTGGGGGERRSSMASSTHNQPTPTAHMRPLVAPAPIFDSGFGDSGLLESTIDMDAPEREHAPSDFSFTASALASPKQSHTRSSSVSSTSGRGGGGGKEPPQPSTNTKTTTARPLSAHSTSGQSKSRESSLEPSTARRESVGGGSRLREERGSAALVESQLLALRQEYDRSCKDREDLRAKNAEMVAELRSLREENAQLHAVMEEAEAMRQEAIASETALKRQIMALNGEVAKERSATDTARAELAEAQNQILQLRERLNGAMREAEEARVMLQRRLSTVSGGAADGDPVTKSAVTTTATSRRSPSPSDDELRGLRQHVAELENQNEQLAAEATELGRVARGMQEELQIAANVRRDMETEAAILREQLASASRARSSSSSISPRNQQHQQQQDVMGSNEENQQLKMKVSDLRLEVFGLREELTQRDQALSEQKRALEARVTECNTMRDRCTKTEEGLEKARSDLVAAKEEIARLDAARQEAVAQCRQLLQESEMARNDLDAERSCNAPLKQRISDSEKQVGELQDMVAQLAASRDEISSELAAFRRESVSLIGQVLEGHAAISHVLDFLAKPSFAADERELPLLDAIAPFRSSLTQLLQGLGGEDVSHTAFEGAVHPLITAQTQQDGQLAARIATLHERIETLIRELGQALHEVAAANQRADGLQGEIDAALERSSSLQADRDRLWRDLSSRDSSLKREADNSEQTRLELQQVKDELDRVRTLRDTMRQEMVGLNTQLRRFEEEAKDSAAAAERAKQQLTLAERDKESIKRDLVEAWSSLEQRKGAEDRLSQIESELRQLSDEKSILTKKLQSAERSAEMYERESKNLSGELVSAREEMHRAKLDMEKAQRVAKESAQKATLMEEERKSALLSNAELKLASDNAQKTIASLASEREEAIRQIRELESELDRAESKLERLQTEFREEMQGAEERNGELGMLRKHLQDIELELKQCTTERDTLRKQLGMLVRERDVQQEEVARAQEDAARLHQMYEETCNDFTQSVQEKDFLQAELLRMRGDVQRHQEEVQSVRTSLVAARDALNRVTEEREDLKAQLLQRQASAAIRNAAAAGDRDRDREAAMTKEIQRLQDLREECVEENRRMSEDRKRLREELAARSNELEAVEAERKRLQQRLETLESSGVDPLDRFRSSIQRTTRF